MADWNPASENLEKTFKGGVRALDGVSVQLRRRRGHHLRPARTERGGQDHRRGGILTTDRSQPDSRARRQGPRVRRRPVRPTSVRPLFGLAGQYAAVDENLTGSREEPEMVSRRLNHLREPVASTRSRSTELLEQFRARRAPPPIGPPGEDLLRVACAADSTSPPRSSPGRGCCSSTSRRPASTRRAGSTSGR